MAKKEKKLDDLEIKNDNDLPDLKALDSLFSKFKKDYGDIVDNLDQGSGRVKRYPIDSYALAEILGSGLVAGRIIEIFGVESSGKTAFCIWLASILQRLSNAYIVYLDFEYAFDPDWAESLGLNIKSDKFKLIHADTLEQGFEILSALAESGQVKYVIWDSTNTAKTTSEEASNFGDANMGNQAKGYSQAFKKIVGKIHKSQMTVAFISQERSTMNVYKPIAVGVGNALKYYSSIRLEVKRVSGEEGWIYDSKKNRIGMMIQMSSVKNKTFFPFRTVTFAFYFDHGFDLNNEVIDYAIKYNLINQNSAYFTIDGIDTTFHGKAKLIDFLRSPEGLPFFESLRHDLDQIIYQSISEEQSAFKKEDQVITENVDN